MSINEIGYRLFCGVSVLVCITGGTIILYSMWRAIALVIGS